MRYFTAAMLHTQTRTHTHARTQTDTHTHMRTLPARCCDEREISFERRLLPAHALLLAAGSSETC